MASTPASSSFSGPLPDDHPAALRLRRELEGDLHLDAYTRGRYATDASIYQIDPLAVIVPRSEADLVRTVQIAAEHELPLIPRGGGTSQGGQAIGRGLVVDTTPHLREAVEIDVEGGTAVVQPGLVLDTLNRRLRPHALHFPVDPSTSSRATLGGMAGNNSAGSRSVRYGMMVDNVRAIEAVLATGERVRLGPVDGEGEGLTVAGGRPSPGVARIVERLRRLSAREEEEIARRFPEIPRDVAGYRLNRLSGEAFNLAHLLVGSEGTLALFARLHLDLAPLPNRRGLGICHFAELREATSFVPRALELDPTAVELVDRRLLDLARRNPTFRKSVDAFVEGDPGALLVVEFSGPGPDEVRAGLRRLEEAVADAGAGAPVVEAVDAELQATVWGVRKAGLNIAMSMPGDTKPIAFIEDCAVPVDRLAEYVARLEAVFGRHDVEGLWYGHASVGCLHVRPALNVKDEGDVRTMRAVAEEAFALARELGGTHSGEHGDGIIRSEFHRPLLGDRIADAFAEVKELFDPGGILNPGTIVDPPPMDDRSLFRYGPDYGTEATETALDWSSWGGLGGAVEMCNNNGACRKAEPGVMCPSYRATRDERDVVRGRANTLRLALSGQLGPDAFTSEGLYQTLDLCVGCKACRSECPTGVDVARMKIEFLHRYRARHGTPLRERLLSSLPRWAPWASRLPFAANLGNRSPPLRWLGEKLLGISSRRRLPTFHAEPFGAREGETAGGPEENHGETVALFVDTFSRWFEPEIPRAAIRVLETAGRRVVPVEPRGGGVPGGEGAGDEGAGARGRRRGAGGRDGRPLCCGRTYLSAGRVKEAREEAGRLVEALRPFVRRGIPVVGLEPSCVLTLRDEAADLVPGDGVREVAEAALLLEEYLARAPEAGGGSHSRPGLGPLSASKVLVHGHCHQKSFGALAPQLEVLDEIPGLAVEAIPSTCCGMAGAFGYEAEHYEDSLAMAELDLLPAVRGAEPGTLLCADGTSCRAQIAHGTGRRALHTAEILARSLESAP